MKLSALKEDGFLNIRYQKNSGDQEKQISIPAADCEGLSSMIDDALELTEAVPAPTPVPAAKAPASPSPAATAPEHDDAGDTEAADTDEDESEEDEDEHA